MSLIRSFMLISTALLGAMLAGCEIMFPVHDGDPEGPNVACLDHGTICIGDSVSLGALLQHHRALGQLKLVDCGFIAPGNTGVQGHTLLRADRFLAGECHEPRYVLSFSNDHRWKNIWIDNGKVVQLSNYPAHQFES